MKNKQQLARHIFNGLRAYPPELLEVIHIVDILVDYEEKYEESSDKK